MPRRKKKVLPPETGEGRESPPVRAATTRPAGRAPADIVTVFLPADQGKRGAAHVRLNGILYTIRRDRVVQVPAEVARILRKAGEKVL